MEEEYEYIEEPETAPDLEPVVEPDEEPDEEYYYYDPVPELLPELEEFLGEEELVMLSDPISSEVDLTETNTLLGGVIIGLGFIFGAFFIRTLLSQVR